MRTMATHSSTVYVPTQEAHHEIVAAQSPTHTTPVRSHPLSPPLCNYPLSKKKPHTQHPPKNGAIRSLRRSRSGKYWS